MFLKIVKRNNIENNSVSILFTLFCGPITAVIIANIATNGHELERTNTEHFLTDYTMHSL